MLTAEAMSNRPSRASAPVPQIGAQIERIKSALIDSRGRLWIKYFAKKDVFCQFLKPRSNCRSSVWRQVADAGRLWACINARTPDKVLNCEHRSSRPVEARNGTPDRSRRRGDKILWGHAKLTWSGNGAHAWLDLVLFGAGLSLEGVETLFMGVMKLELGSTQSWNIWWKTLEFYNEKEPKCYCKIAGAYLHENLDWELKRLEVGITHTLQDVPTKLDPEDTYNCHTRKYEPMERLLATASLVTQYSSYKEEFESIARLQFRLSGRLSINASPYSQSAAMDSPSAILRTRTSFLPWSTGCYLAKSHRERLSSRSPRYKVWFTRLLGEEEMSVKAVGSEDEYFLDTTRSASQFHNPASKKRHLDNSWDSCTWAVRSIRAGGFRASVPMPRPQ
ncbi:hypothetical protein B0H13DRAFT_2283352 [Mycena leptocephala]|nr:hypothetical protein B0H13DRAFT_2283352 [Mycena leptocephala]